MILMASPFFQTVKCWDSKISPSLGGPRPSTAVIGRTVDVRTFCLTFHQEHDWDSPCLIGMVVLSLFPSKRETIEVHSICAACTEKRG